MNIASIEEKYHWLPGTLNVGVTLYSDVRSLRGLLFGLTVCLPADGLSRLLRFVIAVIVCLTNCATSHIEAAESNAALLTTQKVAESKGYLFVASHQDLVSRAKKEGKLRVIISMADGPLKHVTEGFKKKYPFLDTRSQATRGTEVYVRQLQELNAGLTKGVDVNDLQYDHYEEYLPHLKKFDILGMAEQQVLQIPVQMVDPINRNIVAVGSGIQVVAFNRKLIPAEKVPNHWEEFLKAEFKDRKFMLDVRPKVLVALVPVWGLQKTLDFARKLAAQKPVWGRADTRIVTFILAGEHALGVGPNFDSVLRVKAKERQQRPGLQDHRAGSGSAYRDLQCFIYSRKPVCRTSLARVPGVPRGSEDFRPARALRGLGIYPRNYSAASLAGKAAFGG